MYDFSIIFQLVSYVDITKTFASSCIHNWHNISNPRNLRESLTHFFRKYTNCNSAWKIVSITSIKRRVFLFSISDKIQNIYIYIIAIVITLTHLNTIQILLRNSAKESRAKGFPELEIFLSLYFLRARSEYLNLARRSSLNPTTWAASRGRDARWFPRPGVKWNQARKDLRV